jgi:hydroxyacylglutathione hydrolase
MEAPLMPSTVTRLELGSGMFGVNAYLIQTDLGFVLVDTGMRNQQAALEKRLAEERVTPGSLKLILITHGDFDHIGNVAYLRRVSSAPVAMHEGDVRMARDGDMFAGRRRPGLGARLLLPLVARLPEKSRFEPDVLLDEESDLTEYGLPGARILSLHGHSAGSIALLLDDGSLFCGDVLENRKTPRLGSIMDDVPTAQASVDRLKTLGVGTVYPGHGAPFEMADLGNTDSG